MIRVSTLLFVLFLPTAGCTSGGLPSPTVSIAAETAGQPAAESPASDAAIPALDFPRKFAPVPIAGSYQFTEGPAADPGGNVYFSDIDAGKIYRWSPDGSVSLFRDGLSGPNGLAFDRTGNLIACEGGTGRLIAVDPDGRITVLADRYGGVRFNEPNDLWIDPQGGIYFTDPAYRSAAVQDGEDVYYLSPDRSRVERVVRDMVKPNGLVGTPDGKTLYIADWAAGRTYAYAVHADGSLSGKRLFVSSGSDGMTVDAMGNVYLTVPNRVDIYRPDGTRLAAIPIPNTPTNVEFTGPDGRTLFVTAQTAAYTVRMTADDSASAPPPSIPPAHRR
jgi:gluconolactonase